MIKNSVVEDIQDTFIKLFEDTDTEVLGDPMDPQTTVGLPQEKVKRIHYLSK
jgi:hypothetical protein